MEEVPNAQSGRSGGRVLDLANDVVHQEKACTNEDLKAGIDELKAQLSSKRKDTWDKAQIVLMPIVIALTGAIATVLVNSQQQKNARLVADAQIEAAEIQEMARLVSQIPPAKDFLEVNPKNRLMVASLASYGARAVPVLLGLFQGTPIPLRFEIVRALAQIGEPGIPVIVKSLTAHDPEIRLWSIRTLEEMRSSQTAPLVEVLKQDGDSSVRQQAAWTLGKLGAMTAEDDLIRALNDKDGSVRHAAATSLAELKATQATDRLVQLARSESNDQTKRIVLIALSNLAPPAEVKKVLQNLLAATPDSPGVLEALSVFLQKYPDAYPDQDKTKLCTRVLMLADPIIAQSAVDCLEKVRSADAIEGLIIALKHEFSPIATSAAEALGRLRNERAVRPLIEALGSDEESLRVAALKALGQLGDPRARTFIEKELRRPKSEKEREAARFALRMIEFKNTKL